MGIQVWRPPFDPGITGIIPSYGRGFPNPFGYCFGCMPGPLFECDYEI